MVLFCLSHPGVSRDIFSVQMYSGILFLNVLDPVLAFSQLGLFFHPYSHCVHACCSLWFDSVSFPNNMWNSFSCPMYFEDTSNFDIGSCYSLPFYGWVVD